jgi:hypothetical protein
MIRVARLPTTVRVGGAARSLAPLSEARPDCREARPSSRLSRCRRACNRASPASGASLRPPRPDETVRHLRHGHQWPGEPVSPAPPSLPERQPQPRLPVPGLAPAERQRHPSARGGPGVDLPGGRPGPPAPPLPRPDPRPHHAHERGRCAVRPRQPARAVSLAERRSHASALGQHSHEHDSIVMDKLPGVASGRFWTRRERARHSCIRGRVSRFWWDAGGPTGAHVGPRWRPGPARPPHPPLHRSGATRANVGRPTPALPLHHTRQPSIQLDSIVFIRTA